MRIQLRSNSGSVTAATAAVTTSTTAGATTAAATAWTGTVGAAETTVTAATTTAASTTAAAVTTSTTTASATTTAVAATASAAITTSAASAISAATTAAATAAAAITTTTAVAATASAISAATTATGWACFHGTRFVHNDAAATKRLAIHAVDSGLRFGVAAHLDKAKTLGATGFAFHHDLGTGDRAKLRESLLEIAVANGVGQIADVQFVAHLGTPQEHIGNKRWSPDNAINKLNDAKRPDTTKMCVFMHTFALWA